MGHCKLLRIHMSMHGLWNRCMHINILSSWPCSKSSRHTMQWSAVGSHEPSAAFAATARNTTVFAANIRASAARCVARPSAVWPGGAGGGGGGWCAVFLALGGWACPAPASAPGCGTGCGALPAAAAGCARRTPPIASARRVAEAKRSEFGAEARAAETTRRSACNSRLANSNAMPLPVTARHTAARSARTSAGANRNCKPSCLSTGK
mmetsp:Transcript_2238/g.6407  ORF Transcript_2238/g.6407 Transcript_2238/m.6407 type:complete len:208 (+) Transcript_2238:58-681(+)